MEIEKVKKEYDELLRQLSDPELISDSEKFEILSKKKNRLEKIIEKAKEVEEVKNKIEENKTIITAKEDAELSLLAETEISQLSERQKNLEKELDNLLRNNDNPSTSLHKSNAAIVEIRAGAGGEESALFASDLLRMYSRYAGGQGWKERVLDSRQSETGGLKEVVFELRNGDVFSKMEFEGGVHRVQRIPETEKSGRIHTSTATVAVLPKPQKTEVKINSQDLKIDFYRASGPGGQYVNKRETAVRLTHLPSGIVVTCQTERNQLKNKENALAILEARLLEKKEMADLEKMGERRRSQIKWAKRAEKIRTYNFPQDRVTDHRIKKSWHNIEKILDGDLEEIISALEKSTHSQKGG